jgi:hypothetical protein
MGNVTESWNCVGSYAIPFGATERRMFDRAIEDAALCFDQSFPHSASSGASKPM